MRPPPFVLFAFVFSAASLACSSAGGDGDAPGEDGGNGGGGSHDAFVPPADACDGPLGKPRDPESLPSCCSDFPDTAHCVQTSTIPSQLQSILATCDAKSSCVPDEFIRTGGVFTPKKCTAFGGDGRCVSQCIPQVAEKAGILLQDVCNDWEKCVPCINPLDHTSTGVCDLVGTCNGVDAGKPDTSPVDTGPPVCPHTGPPVVDPTKLPTCQCGDAHCVSKSLVPPAEASELAACSADPSGYCVPDTFIASGGEIIPPSCASIEGAEGRCLSTCLPKVAAMASELPRSTCGATEKCVPCYDPISLADTGACRLSCDPGPKSPPKPLPKCCSDAGSCVPASLVPPDSASALKQDSCASDADLCVPDVFLHKTWTRIDCEAATWLGDAGPGVCMPDCIKGMSFLLLQGACPDGDKCAPCKDPITGKDTGACEFKP